MCVKQHLPSEERNRGRAAGGGGEGGGVVVGGGGAQTHIHCMVMSSEMTSSHGGEPRDLMG